MQADAMSLTFLEKEGIVKIPFFQRGYVWDKTNWADLLEDLYDETKSPFLGSLILKQLDKQTGKIKEVLVIDGQQRLTTLSILIKALYDTFSDEIKINCETAIQSYLFYKINRTDKEKFVRINHSQLDAQYYNKVIEGNITEDELEKIIIADEQNKIISRDNKILQCYKYFKKELELKDEEKRQWLFDYLLNDDNNFLVIIDLQKNDDEQSIFDTINSAGVRLSSADIIKNALFQKALDIIKNQNDVIKLYNTFWENIFSGDDDSKLYWETPRSTGRLMRDNIEILLHSVAVIKNFFDPDKHNLSDLSKLYKDYIESLTIISLTDFIKEISDYAKIYRENIITFDKSTLFSFENNHQRLFHILDVCEISTFHPYILLLFYQNKTNIDDLDRKLFVLEKYIIRRLIKKEDTKNYNKICKDFIKDGNLLVIGANAISDDDIKSSLENITNKNASLLLFWIELYRRHIDRMQTLKELKYDYSLEHIMPQKWEEYWSSIPVYDINSNEINNDEQAKIIRNRAIYSIGNMTLLNSRLNSSVRNYPFIKKIEGEGKKKGIKHYSDLRITKDDIITPYENGTTTWDERNIHSRTVELSKEILTIW